MPYSMNKKLLEIFDKVAEKNIDVYNKNKENKSYIIYPEKRNKTTRISEQETRFILANVLEKNKVYYSVETPTENMYSFSNPESNGMSAQTDLTIYNNEKEKIVNIELKAHNPEAKAIAKDIEKLMGEPIEGAWYHTLKNINSRTIESLLEKMYKAIANNVNNITNPNGIFFYILILEKNKRYCRYIDKDNLLEIEELDFLNIKKWKKIKF